MDPGGFDDEDAEWDDATDLPPRSLTRNCNDALIFKSFIHSIDVDFLALLFQQMEALS